MRLLITEFITGGGMANHPIPEGLKQEGLLMLRSVLSDCKKIDGTEIMATVDARFLQDVEFANKVEIHKAEDYLPAIIKLAEQSDITWVIAPESDKILHAIIEKLADCNIKLVNCNAESIQLTSDKLICTQILLENNLPAVENFSSEYAAKYEQKTVIKNRFGVGSEGLKICRSGAEALLEVGDDMKNWLIQPYVAGESLSLSIVCVEGKAEVLSCNRQIFTESNEPKLKMCQVNAIPVTHKHKVLANQIATIFPGMRAYVGVDYIDCDDDIKIVDINPRLTTSYAGLSEVINTNPAQLCLDATLNSALPMNLQRRSDIAEVVIG